MTVSDEFAPIARDRLALALDVASLDAAVDLATRLRPWFSVAKIGLELFAAEGPLAVDTLLDEGFRVFVDLKLHDIPTTVGRAARKIGSMGVSYTTVHAAGGDEMLRAAVEGFEEGWAGAVAMGHVEPAEGSAGILAVTVLTSDPGAGTDVVGSRAAPCGRDRLSRSGLRGGRSPSRVIASARTGDSRPRDSPGGVAKGRSGPRGGTLLCCKGRGRPARDR